MKNVTNKLITIFMVIAVQMSGWAAAQEMMTIEDLTAGFHANRSQFKSPRIIIRRKGYWLAGWRGLILKNAIEAEKLAESDELSSKEKTLLLIKANRIRQSAAPIKPLTSFWDYRTDWKTVHIRKPRFDPEETPDTWSFPNDPINDESLISIYKDYSVSSFRPKLQPRTRVWNGVFGLDEFSGRVTDKHIHQIVSGFNFPPLAVQNTEWGPTGTWHAIDQFFVDIKLGTTEISLKQYQGRQVSHVRHVSKLVGPINFPKTEGEFKIGQIAEAWIDPSQGFLPLKMEWHTEIYRDGKLVVSVSPNNKMEVTEVRKIKGAGYYPWKGSASDYINDPYWTKPSATMAEMLAGTAGPGPAMMIHTKMEWEILRIEPNSKITDAMLALEFPDTTNYYDEVNQRIMIEGLTVKEVDRLINSGEQNGFNLE